MAAEVAKIKREIQVGDKVWVLKDFIENESITKPDNLLTPWLSRGDLWMVYSGPGVGKTFFNLNVAYAVASGGSFLHWKAKEARKVLYVDGEMSAWDMQSRLKGIVAAAKRDKNGDYEAALENFNGYAATSQDLGTLFFDLANPEGRQVLVDLSQDMDLVIIDNLTTVLRGADPDKAMDWTPIQDTLVELRKQGTAVILVHHTNKSGDQTGTKAKEAILNGMMKLERPHHYSSSEGAKFIIEWGKTRGLAGVDTAPINAHLVEDEDTKLPRWKYEVLDDLKIFEVMRFAQSGDYATQKEIAAAMGVSAARVNQLKNSAINDYQIFTSEQFRRWLNTAKELRRQEEAEDSPF